MNEYRISGKTMTDEELVASLFTGKNDAFSVLYERYAARGVGYARSLLKNEDDSEEAVQEAFCRLLKPKNMSAISPERGGFGALFFGTIRNLSIDMLRKQRHRTHISLDAVKEPSVDRQGSGFEGIDLEKKMNALIEALPANQADALKLKLEGGLSYDEIANVLECTRAQVRTWIYRARRQMESSFRKEGLIEGKE